MASKDQLYLCYRYPIPCLQFTDSMMDQLDDKAKLQWNEFLRETIILKQAGIQVIIVPLMYDTLNETWWSNYSKDFCDVFHLLNNDDHAYMVLTIKLTSDFKYLLNSRIRIDHIRIIREKKKILCNRLSHYPWFDWSGITSDAMYIQFH